MCNSWLGKSYSEKKRYVALHSTPPSFVTAHRNMTSASFCPFLINSCSSMRLINALGPCQINTVRNIDNPAAGADGAALARPDGVFFFQAEDGIRDHCVTGVQTCALPI